MNVNSQGQNGYTDLLEFLLVEFEEEKTLTTAITSAQTNLDQYISPPLEKRLTLPLDFWTKHCTLLDPLFFPAVKYAINRLPRSLRKGYFQRQEKY